MAEGEPVDKKTPVDPDELRKKVCCVLTSVNACSAGADTAHVQKYDPSTFLENAKHFDIRKVPCARDALLHGIGGGMLIGALNFVRTRASLSPF